MVNQSLASDSGFAGVTAFWIWLYHLWPGCLQTLQVFKPDILVRWHRKGFRLYTILKIPLPLIRTTTCFS